MSQYLFLSGSERDLRHSRRLWVVRWGAAGLLVLLVGVAAVCFPWPDGGQIRQILISIWLAVTPTPWLRSHIKPEYVEQGMNAAVFIPIVACAVLVLPRVRLWVWWVLAACGATSIELIQLAFLSGRNFNPVDALFNSLGGIVGSLLGAFILYRLFRRWERIDG